MFRRGQTRWRGCWLGALVMLAPAPAVFAQSAAPTSGAESSEYRQVIQQALREYGLGHWDEAEALFRKAHAIDPSARTLRGMGLAEYENRRYVLAIEHLRAALRDTRSPLTPDQRNEAERILADASGFVARFALEITPPNATLTVNGIAAQPNESGELLLDPGEHTVVAKADGYEIASTRVSAVSGQSGRVVIALQPLDAASASATAAPSATEASAPQNAAPAARHHRLWTWVAAGAVPVFAGVAAIVWFSGQSDLSDIRSACRAQDGCTDAEVARRVDRAGLDGKEVLSGVLLGCAGAALVTSAVLFFVEGDAGSESKPSATAGVSASPLAVTVWSRF